MTDSLLSFLLFPFPPMKERISRPPLSCEFLLIFLNKMRDIVFLMKLTCNQREFASSHPLFLPLYSTANSTDHADLRSLFSWVLSSVFPEGMDYSFREEIQGPNPLSLLLFGRAANSDLLSRRYCLLREIARTFFFFYARGSPSPMIMCGPFFLVKSLPEYISLVFAAGNHLLDLPERDPSSLSRRPCPAIVCWRCFSPSR